VSSRNLVRKQNEKGFCLTPQPEELHAADPQGYMVALALVKVTAELTIIGKARCRSFMVPAIPSVGPYELSTDLAVVDAAEKLIQYLHGQHQPATREEVQIWRRRIALWRSTINWFDYF